MRAPRLALLLWLASLGAAGLAATGLGATPAFAADDAPAAAPRPGPPPTPPAAGAPQRLGVVTPRQPGLRAALAIGGAALLLGGGRLAGASAARRRLRDGGLAALGVAGALLYLDPVSVARGQIHVHEFFHYYLGAKFAPELESVRLYACATVADHEVGLAGRVERRWIRNQESYALERAAAVVADSSRCKAHFSEDRWRLFRHDVRFFRRKIHPARWERLMMDHGYNGTPAWALLGSTLAGRGPVSEARLRGLALIDPLLLVATAGVTGWAFGWRTLCVALLFLGTYSPGALRWTAGAYLRQDWLLACAAGVALVRRGRPAASGAAFAVAGMLRIFPFAILGGIAAKGLAEMLRVRRLRLDPAHVRMAVAVVLTGGLLVGASTWADGPRAWPRFFTKAGLHLDSPLLNYMGLATLVSYHPATSSTRTLEPAAVDPVAAWKRARQGTLHGRRPLLWGAMLALGGLLLAAARGQPDWVAAALGVGLVPVAGELTCYYYAVFFVFALLAASRAAAGALVLACAALSQAVESWWIAVDDIFTAQSALVLLCIVAVWSLFAFTRARGASWLDPAEGRAGHESVSIG